MVEGEILENSILMIYRIGGINMNFTSNFYRCKITFGDYTYNSVEHAYQASKTIIPSEREAIRNIKDPLEA